MLNAELDYLTSVVFVFTHVHVVQILGICLEVS